MTRRARSAKTRPIIERFGSGSVAWAEGWRAANALGAIEVGDIAGHRHERSSLGSRRLRRCFTDRLGFRNDIAETFDSLVGQRRSFAESAVPTQGAHCRGFTENRALAAFHLVQRSRLAAPGLEGNKRFIAPRLIGNGRF